MAEYFRKPERFISRGMQISKPVDLLDPGKFSRLKNVVSREDGSLQPRPGLTQINATQLNGPVHSIRRINDLAVGPTNWARVVGAGTRLYTGQAAFTEVLDLLGAAGIGQAWSGNPISMVPFRPDRSPEPWMYCADSAKMAKVRTNGGAANIGIAPPLVAPDVTQDPPDWKMLERFSTFPINWTASGVAGAIGSGTDDYVVEEIVYDSGTSGPASMVLVPGTDDEPGPGATIIFELGNPEQEECIIQQVLRSPTAAGVGATIEKIVYDSTGDDTGTGLCSIVPSVPISDLAPHSVLILDQGGGNEEYMQVIAAVVSSDGDIAIRVSTVANHVAAETIEGRSSFRLNTFLTHAAAENLQRFFYINQATGAGTYIIERTVDLDLTFTEQNYDPTTGAPAVKRQLKLDDEVHLSLFILGLERVVEGKIMFDVDPNVNDFTRNFFFHSFGPNDLVPVAQSTDTVPNTLSAAQTAAQIEATAIPSSIRGQTVGAFQGNISAQPQVRRTVTGDDQWSELRFKLKDLVRVGALETQGLSDVKAVRIQMEVNNNIAVIAVASLWVAGTKGPDTGQFGAPYFYRFRARQPNTGARSLTSPATRFGTGLRRQSATITMPYVNDPQVDSTVGGVLDVYRFGGNVLSWRYVGSTPNNAAGNNQFEDDLPDDRALASPAEETDTFQPFPITDRPKSGTCDVCGSTVIWKTGDKFDIRWAPGTEIKINGIPYTLYSQPSTFSGLTPPEADFLEIVENGNGAQTDVEFVVEEPTLLGQPLKFMWGPTPDTNQMFAVGDPQNPGRLYYTNPHDPDSADEVNSVDVTNPSEPLLAGAILRDGINILWSTKRAFRVLPSQSNPGQYVAVPIQNSKGLLGSWAFCVGGPLAYYRSRDGCYVTDGGSSDPISITDDDFYPLFPHDGVVGAGGGGLLPPDDTQLPAQRMSFDHSMVRYTYLDTNGDRQSLVYDVREKGWYPWNYETTIPLMFYEEEGEGVNSLLVGAEGFRVHQVAGTTDNGVLIECEIRPGSQPADDFGNEKLWGDFKLDMLGAGNQVTIQPLFNEEQLAAVAQVLSPVATRALLEIKTNNGDGQDARSATISIRWSTKSGSIPKFFGWEAMGSHYPVGLLAVKTISGTHALSRYQHIREAFMSLIAPADVTLAITIDGMTRTYTIPATGTEHLKPRIAVDAIKGKMFGYKLDSTQVFKFFVADSELLVGEWGRTGPYQVIRPFGPEGP